MLESPATLLTTDYHRLPRLEKLYAHSASLQLAWEKVQLACETDNPRRMGEAATISAIASQHLLPKPGFDTLRRLVEECDLYGINVAHSGSVVGLMLDRQRHDIEYLQRRLGETRLSELWPRQHLLRMVQGGVELR